MGKIYLRHQCTMFQPMKYFKWPGGQNTSEGHTKNSSFGQGDTKIRWCFCIQVVKKKKSSFIKCILNLRFLKKGLLSEFQLYLGLLDTLTSSLYHCFHGNGNVNGYSSIHHYRSRNQISAKASLGSSYPFPQFCNLHRSVHCRLFREGRFQCVLQVVISSS